ncbi:MAG: DNA polymerase III subunit beta [Bifidobacteriaceae bacterium]|jgi:DNA polymerase-3 subunit beta|nr:DNA polymerase III subunit beta [Bifidobacteriaceae bacterium]
MKFRLDRDTLADAVAWVARGLPARPPAPVLAGLHLTAAADDGGSLAMAAFDYEISARAELVAEVIEGGEVLVSGRLLTEISRLLPEQPVVVEIDGPRAILTCGTSTFTLPCMPLEDYPTLPPMPAKIGAVESSAFAQAVSQTALAATKDETLPLLTGVMIEFGPEKLTFLATDRYRLAIREIPWTSTDPEVSAMALVKAKTLQDLAKAFPHTEQVSLALSPGGGSEIIGFEAQGRHSTSLLIQGDYPAVRRLLPTGATSGAVVSVPALVEAVRRVSLVADRNTPLQIAFSAGEAVLNAGSGDDAKASEVIEATLTGEDIAVAFNPGYLIDGLSVITSPYVHVAMSGVTKPVLFQGKDSVDGQLVPDFQYLLVPIRFAV